MVPLHPGDLRVDEPGDGGDDRDPEEQPAAWRELLGEAEEEELRGEEVALQPRDVLDLRLAVAHQDRVGSLGIAVEESSQLLAGKAPGIVEEEGFRPLPGRRPLRLRLLAPHTLILRPPASGVAVRRGRAARGKPAAVR